MFFGLLSKYFLYFYSYVVYYVFPLDYNLNNELLLDFMGILPRFAFGIVRYFDLNVC